MLKEDIGLVSWNIFVSGLDKQLSRVVSVNLILISTSEAVSLLAGTVILVAGTLISPEVGWNSASGPEVGKNQFDRLGGGNISWQRALPNLMLFPIAFA